MKKQSKNKASSRAMIIALSCVLIVAIVILFIVLFADNNESETNASDEQEQTLLEINETSEPVTEFVPDKNDTVIEAIDDLEYCKVYFSYYFNSDGVLYRVFHRAEYSDENRAKADYALMEAMDQFSECSINGTTILCALKDSEIKVNYPDATEESIINYVESKEMTWEKLQ